MLTRTVVELFNPGGPARISAGARLGGAHCTDPAKNQLAVLLYAAWRSTYRWRPGVAVLLINKTDQRQIRNAEPSSSLPTKDKQRAQPPHQVDFDI
ncbi:hypothetical protein DIJ64_13275 [Mycobacterium leprae]|uniref:Uncharacterized protein n=1 Tax=Mycobacterium leprae TaxID=1769 RepID=A0AAD0P8U0_MYCLR|nr:hypothetical protein DIJ64_13275 [Mycobacterium leprae]OAR19864.1 hypothetical protein A8144_13220 [Mycobacterium leprae 3125609]OAX70218.1 hypothetical protein A3216_13215 [Mycobacterium leprae 7935681]